MGSRWLLNFQAIDPKDPTSKTWRVGVQERKYRSAQHHGHEKEIARLMLVREVLEGGTIQLYEGWSRPDKEEDCYVYVGNPEGDYRSLSIQTPAPPRSFFLVFVLNDGTIDHWTWRKMAEREDGVEVPKDVTGKLIWSQNPS